MMFQSFNLLLGFYLCSEFQLHESLVHTGMHEGLSAVLTQTTTKNESNLTLVFI